MEGGGMRKSQSGKGNSRDADSRMGVCDEVKRKFFITCSSEKKRGLPISRFEKPFFFRVKFPIWVLAEGRFALLSLAAAE
ncbi:hypothetical protein CDAR_49371 [Caerostris darwini]|nr:hypothetical protein CDAR_49371 [Caerostris darwini]